LLGASSRPSSRRAAPVIALGALLCVFLYQLSNGDKAIADAAGTFRVFQFAQYIKMLAAGVGMLFVLLAWPSNMTATGNASLDYGTECGEFFGLMLLSIAGIFLVAGANDIITLFLGIELASIPTYIMVSISRPIAVAQEAGVKYFFLGAMAAAIMLFGFSYLYGTTGLIHLDAIGERFRSQSGNMLGLTHLSSWQLLAVVMLIAGFSFKIAAVPMHFYAGDVYQGAATPLTALLSFVPKTAGIVAIIKLIYVAGGNSWATPEMLTRLLWALAAITMTVGNILGLIQIGNLKRVLAYSSIAHSGYMLVGLTALASSSTSGSQEAALQGVLFYLAAYGIMNAGTFGVLMLLPARAKQTWSGAAEPIPPATTAETFEDIAGQARQHPMLAVAMAVCCFSLIGLPLTIGFFGKLYLIKPALDSKLYGLVVITMINAAISAGYYLKIVGTMFLRAEAEPSAAATTRMPRPLPIRAAVAISVCGTLLFGTIFPATQLLISQVVPAAQIESPSAHGVPTASASR